MGFVEFMVAKSNNTDDGKVRYRKGTAVLSPSLTKALGVTDQKRCFGLLTGKGKHAGLVVLELRKQGRYKLCADKKGQPLVASNALGQAIKMVRPGVAVGERFECAVDGERLTIAVNGPLSRVGLRDPEELTAQDLVVAIPLLADGVEGAQHAQRQFGLTESALQALRRAHKELIDEYSGLTSPGDKNAWKSRLLTRLTTKAA